MPLDDSDVERMLEDYAKAGEDYAKAKARATVMAENRKIVHAQLLRAAEDVVSGQQARDAWSRAHPKYKEAVELWGESIEQEHRAEAKREYARLELDAWRSLNANARRIV